MSEQSIVERLRNEMSTSVVIKDWDELVAERHEAADVIDERDRRIKQWKGLDNGRFDSQSAELTRLREVLGSCGLLLKGLSEGPSLNHIMAAHARNYIERTPELQAADRQRGGGA